MTIDIFKPQLLDKYIACYIVSSIKCDKFIYLAPAASSKDVYTFIVILAQLWLLGNHNELDRLLTIVFSFENPE